TGLCFSGLVMNACYFFLNRFYPADKCTTSFHNKKTSSGPEKVQFYNRNVGFRALAHEIFFDSRR
ncbi:MAG: hypothetical protein WC151_01845, partial [Bacteroidales bacterium]|nr:hypothetical protein [Bacteroidales bacterium]